MNRLERAAVEYAKNEWGSLYENTNAIGAEYGEISVQDFLKGAEYALQWNKPEDSLPDNNIDILVKDAHGTCSVATFYRGEFHPNFWAIVPGDITHWKHI